MTGKHHNKRKMQTGKRMQPTVPNVGIFWVLGKRILIDGTPITQAEGCSDFKIHDGDHYTVWGTYQKAAVVSEDLEYEDVPRGRVMYNTKTEQYLLLADRCILKDPGLVSRIEGKMNLPHDSTRIGSDDHYRCPRCLKKDL